MNNFSPEQLSFIVPANTLDHKPKEGLSDYSFHKQSFLSLPSFYLLFNVVLVFKNL